MNSAPSLNVQNTSSATEIQLSSNPLRYFEGTTQRAILNMEIGPCPLRIAVLQTFQLPALPPGAWGPRLPTGA